MQIWAIITATGYVLRYTDGPSQHPSDVGHADECLDALVWPLSAEPDAYNGETIEPLTGALVFEAALVREIVRMEIKEATATAIELVSPLWRQANDLRTPTAEGEARFAAIDALRAQSNAREVLLDAATSAADIRAIRSDLQ